MISCYNSNRKVMHAFPPLGLCFPVEAVDMENLQAQVAMSEGQG